MLDGPKFPTLRLLLGREWLSLRQALPSAQLKPSLSSPTLPDKTALLLGRRVATAVCASAFYTQHGGELGLRLVVRSHNHVEQLHVHVGVFRAT